MLTFEQRRLLLHNGSAEYGDLLLKLLEAMAEVDAESNYKRHRAGFDDVCTCAEDVAYGVIRDYEIQAMGEHVAG